jgi:hypothetical protein
MYQTTINKKQITGTYTELVRLINKSGLIGIKLLNFK